MLAEGDLLCIFPEIDISHDGHVQPFNAGIMKILARRPVPMVPVALQDLSSSTCSRTEGGTALVRPLRRGLCAASGWPPGKRDGA